MWSSTAPLWPAKHVYEPPCGVRSLAMCFAADVSSLPPAGVLLGGPHICTSPPPCRFVHALWPACPRAASAALRSFSRS